MSDNDDMCAICHEHIHDSELFETPCKTKVHRFHIDCIHEHGKVCFSKAVHIKGDSLAFNEKCLPSCPICREPITCCYNTKDMLTFFLISAKQQLMVIGTVQHPFKHPAVKRSQCSYVRRRGLLAV